MHPPSAQLLRALQASIWKRPVCYHPTSQNVFSRSSLSSPVRSVSRSTSSIPRRTSPTSRPPRSHDRGPKSDEDTQTDFGAMNIFGNMGAPATSIDACVSDGFHFNNGLKTAGGSGIILVGGDAFSWRPWEVTNRKKPADLLTKAGTLDIEGDGGAWGLLELLWPKPDLLVVGTGGKVWPLSKQTRESINRLGIKIDVMDTGNACAAFNLLATERGTDVVAAAMLPVGWPGR